MTVLRRSYNTIHTIIYNLQQSQLSGEHSHKSQILEINATRRTKLYAFRAYRPSTKNENIHRQRLLLQAPKTQIRPLHGLALKVRPLALNRLILKILPAMEPQSSATHSVIGWDKMGGNLHLGLGHVVDQLQLALGDLDDLLDQASANLVLEILDPAWQSVSTQLYLNRIPPACTYCSAVSWGSSSHSTCWWLSSGFRSP